MAIDRPGGDRPAPEGSQQSGERRAAAILSREEWRAAAGENSCRTPLRAGDRARERDPRPDQPSKGRDGTADPRQTRKEITTAPPSPPTTTHRLRDRNRPHLLAPPRTLKPAAQRTAAPDRPIAVVAPPAVQDAHEVASHSRPSGRTFDSGERPDPRHRGHASGKTPALNGRQPQGAQRRERHRRQRRRGDPGGCRGPELSGRVESPSGSTNRERRPRERSGQQATFEACR
jgi:hypothetical protein